MSRYGVSCLLVSTLSLYVLPTQRAAAIAPVLDSTPFSKGSQVFRNNVAGLLDIKFPSGFWVIMADNVGIIHYVIDGHTYIFGYYFVFLFLQVYKVVGYDISDYLSIISLVGDLHKQTFFQISSTYPDRFKGMNETKNFVY